MANTTADKIQLLADNKASIKTAIESMSPQIAPTDVMSNWPRSIMSIQSGGGGGMIGHKLTLVFPGGDVLLYCYVYLADGTTVIKTSNSTVDNAVAFYMTTYISYDGDNYLRQFTVSGSKCNFKSQNNLHITYSDHTYTSTFLVTEDSTLTMYGFHEGGGGCLLKGTRIMLSDMTEKNIEDITYDDELLVWNFDEGKLDSAKPAWIKKRETIDYYFKNTLSSGKTLLTTGQSSTGWGHRIYDSSKKKFIYTTETVSDKIFTLDGNEMHMSCQRINEECEYYNIITKKHFNLFANRILTSCSLNNMLYEFGDDMKFVKKDGNTASNGYMFDTYDVSDYVDDLRLNEMTLISEDNIVAYIGKMNIIKMV